MEKRRIGSLEVSVVGLGCNNFGWRIDAAASERVVHAALDAGIDFFDTADLYDTGKSEEFLGRALKGRHGASGGASGNRAIIATKFGMKLDDQRQGAHPDYVLRAAEDSLRRLGVERIDLYQLHQPDPVTPIADTLGALNELVRAGKVGEIGCSNFSAAQLREARQAAGAGARFVSVQNQYSLFHREPEAEVIPECSRRATCGHQMRAFTLYPKRAGASDDVDRIRLSVDTRRSDECYAVGTAVPSSPGAICARISQYARSDNMREAAGGVDRRGGNSKVKRGRPVGPRMLCGWGCGPRTSELVAVILGNPQRELVIF